MPRVSSSVMVKEAELTGRNSSESEATTSAPCKMTVSASSSKSSFAGLNRSVVVPLVWPAGMTMSKDSTSWNVP